MVERMKLKLFFESSDGTVTGINFILIACYTDDIEGVLFGEKRNDGGTIIHITTDSFPHMHCFDGLILTLLKMVPLLTVSAPHPHSQSHPCIDINHFDGLVILILLKEVFLVRFLTNFHKDPITHTHIPTDSFANTRISITLMVQSLMAMLSFFLLRIPAHLHTDSLSHSPTCIPTHTSASLCWPRRIDNVESVLFGECSYSGDDGGAGASG